MQMPPFYPPPGLEMHPQLQQTRWGVLPSEVVPFASMPSGFVPPTPMQSANFGVTPFTPLSSAELIQQQRMLGHGQQQLQFQNQLEQKLRQLPSSPASQFPGNTTAELVSPPPSEREAPPHFQTQLSVGGERRGGVEERSPSEPASASGDALLSQSSPSPPQEERASASQQAEDRPPREQVMAILRRVLKSLPETDLVEIQQWIRALLRSGKEQGRVFEVQPSREARQHSAQNLLAEEDPQSAFAAQTAMPLPAGSPFFSSGSAPPVQQQFVSYAPLYVQPGLQMRQQVFERAAVAALEGEEGGVGASWKGGLSSPPVFCEGFFPCPSSQANFERPPVAVAASEAKEAPSARPPCFLPPLKKGLVGSLPPGSSPCLEGAAAGGGGPASFLGYAGSYSSFARRHPGLVLEAGSRGSSAQNDERAVRKGPMCRLPVTCYDALQPPRPAVLKSVASLPPPASKAQTQISARSQRRSFSLEPRRSSLSSFLCCTRPERQRSAELLSARGEDPRNKAAAPSSEERPNDEPLRDASSIYETESASAAPTANALGQEGEIGASDLAPCTDSTRKTEEAILNDGLLQREEETKAKSASSEYEAAVCLESREGPTKRGCPSAVLLEALLNEVRVLRESIGARKNKELVRLDQQLKEIQKQNLQLQAAAAAAARDCSEAREEQVFLERQRDLLFEARQRLHEAGREGERGGGASSTRSRPLTAVGTSEELFASCWPSLHTGGSSAAPWRSSPQRIGLVRPSSLEAPPTSNLWIPSVATCSPESPSCCVFRRRQHSLRRASSQTSSGVRRFSLES